MRTAPFLWLAVCAAALPLLLSGPGRADPVNVVSPATLTTDGLLDFEGLPAPANHDEVLVLPGARFAERFVGQALSFSGNFDVLSGIPTGPLTPQAGAANQNVHVGPPAAMRTTSWSGLGPLGFPNINAIGEGAVSILFDVDQFELGFDIVGADGGSATVSFFRRDGSLIQTVVLGLPLPRASFAFRRDLDVADIAGISIHNNDPAGIGYDNVRFHQAAVIPESSTLTLLGIGTLSLFGYGWRRRKRTPA